MNVNHQISISARVNEEIIRGFISIMVIGCFQANKPHPISLISLLHFGLLVKFSLNADSISDNTLK